MNKLFLRQIRKYLGESEPIPEKFKLLFQAISDAYDGFDSDRSLMERSFDLSSQELINTNEELRKEIAARKRAEEYLRESRQMLQLVLDNIPQRIFWKDRNSVYLGCNKNFAYDAGFPHQEIIIGKTDYDLPWKKEETEFYRECDRKVMETDTSQYDIIEPQLQADGKQAWLRTNKIPLHDSDGNVVGILGMYEDITERKIAEEMLRHSEELLRATIESTKDGILVVDEKGKVTHFNSEFISIWGIPESVLKTKDDAKFLESVLHKIVDPEVFINKVRQLYKSDEVDFDTILLKDGKILERFSCPLIQKGSIAGRVWNFRDVTQRKKAEEEIRESRKTLQTILDSMPVGVIIVGKDKKIRKLNNTALKLMKYESHDHAIGRICYEIFCSKEKDKCPIIDIGNSHDISERILTTKSGENIPILKSVFPIVIENEEVLLETFIDITDIRKAREALQEAKKSAEHANRMKSQFLANVSHEIRTPLNSIIGFSEIIGNSDNLDEVHMQVRVILTESETLLQFINDLLDNAKIEAGKMEFEIIPFDLMRLMMAITSYANFMAQKKGNEYCLVIDDNVPRYLMGDEFRLRQIILNLVNNAIKFTEKGSVTVKVECLKNEAGCAKLRFSVQDTGIGIPKEKQDEIFRIFTQADGSTTRRYGGTGLGTSIAKNLAELMGGTIGLESEPGQGSTFWFIIYLAISSQPVKEEVVDRIHGKSQTDMLSAQRIKGNILVVEDYSPNQEVIRFHLAREGHILDIVNNGYEALQLCKNKKYDLILMDIHMPKMDGYEATRRIRTESSINIQTPIIGLTADAYASTREECLKHGMNDVLTKPFRCHLFLECVNLWLSASVNIKESGSAIKDEKPVISEASDENKLPYPIDYEQGIKEFAGDRIVFETVVAGFLKNVKEQIEAVKQAITELNAEKINFEMHKIRGGAANITAKPLSDIAACMENLGKTGQFDKCTEVMVEFENEFEKLEKYAAEKNKR